MLEIVVKKTEVLNPDTNTFYSTNGGKLQLEHSLLSLRKWESKWHIPFLNKKTEKTKEQITDYIRFMTINTVSDPNIYDFISLADMQRIGEYIEDPMSATWFNDSQEKQGRIGKEPVVTAEIIYYWMVTLQIPMECQKWHLNQLMTLIKVINIKNSAHDPNKKKRPKKDIIEDYNAMNEARLKKYNTTG